MTEVPACETCGAPLSATDKVGELCGACLVRLALEVRDGTGDSASDAADAAPASPGTRIGPYRL